MAVHTHLSEKDIVKIISKYDIGELKLFSGIKEGIENTNYLIQTQQDSFVLTIFEKRLKKSKLPYILKLMKRLNNSGIKCPIPVADKKEKLINLIGNKQFSLFSFINGKSKKKWTDNDCYQVGAVLGNLHQVGNNFLPHIENDFSIDTWKNLFQKCNKKGNLFENKTNVDITNEIQFILKNWPQNLPMGIIHADLFPDNIFFSEDKICGVIDFYFSCYDFLMYDLAIAVNAWCFKKGNFMECNLKQLIKGYESIRKISTNEKNKFNILLRGACLRFLTTRMYDSVFKKKSEYVLTKDPREYLKILRFHQKNNNGLNYF